MFRNIALILCLAITSTLASVRTCYKCEGINCYRTSLNQTEQCLDPLDFCVTVFDKSGVAQRGCYLSIPEENRSKCDTKKNHPDCQKCISNLCNNLNREDLLCIQCDSKSNPDCGKNGGVAPKVCPIGTSPNTYCYVKYGADGTTFRGCLTNIIEQIDCLSNTKCMLCMPSDVNGCNRIDFQPGSARSFLIN